MEKFYGCLYEFFRNCNLGSHEESIIRDVFIDNMQDGENQRQLLKGTRTPNKALELAINIEMGIHNQLKISGTSANTLSNQLAIPSNNSVQKSWNYPTTTTKIFKPSICSNCGYTWSPSHRQNCPARGKVCKNCGINNQSTKVCRKPKNPIKSKPRVNIVGDVPSEAATVGTSATVEDQVNQVDSMLQKHNIYDANCGSDYDNLDNNCVAVIANDENLREVEPVNLQMQFGNLETKALVDSGSVCKITLKNLAIW